jgi:hypothetical protein
MSQTQPFETTDSGGRSFVTRVFGVGFRRETYANVAYLLVRFPLGIAYFTTFVTGLALGVGLVPVVVGIPILAGVIGLGGYVGVVEATLLNGLLGRDVSYTPTDPSELSVTTYLKTVVTDPRNYLWIAFALGSFGAGISVFVMLTVVFALGMTLVAAPLLYWIPGIEYAVMQPPDTIELGVVSIDAASTTGLAIDTLPEALIGSVIGVVVCLVGLHVVNLTAWLVGGITERLLAIAPE